MPSSRASTTAAPTPKNTPTHSDTSNELTLIATP
jgi:hypothetical protein